MAFTGDLEQLHIVDIIQLLHTTRKSGTFSVRGERGESRIIFSNGHIVGASHLNNRVRIGSVLVNTNAISKKDLEEALEVQKKAGKNRKPLVTTLIDMGRLDHNQASQALRKLIELTVVELIGWTRGTFTLDANDIAVSPECSYPIGSMDQAMGLDAQMVLMDALRVYDERQRDREGGKDVQPYEEQYADVVEPVPVTVGVGAALTADDLGLGELDQLERKIPEPAADAETFDPAELHRQKIRETLAGLPVEQQEVFVAFLERSTSRMGDQNVASRREGGARALILFSEDELVRHAVMTICKGEGVLVFVTDGEDELDRIIAQCLVIKTSPILVIDCAGTGGGIFSTELITALRRRIRERFPRVSLVQLASSADFEGALASYRDGVSAVFPRPLLDRERPEAVGEFIEFLQTFDEYINAFFNERRESASFDAELTRLRDRVAALRELSSPREILPALLRPVSEVFERAVLFTVRPDELNGESGVGIYAQRDAGPTTAAGLDIPLAQPSIFREVVERGAVYFGDSDDAVLRERIFGTIGAPLARTVLLLPVRAGGRVTSLVYGDFGQKPPPPVRTELLEILALQAGSMVECGRSGREATART